MRLKLWRELRLAKGMKQRRAVRNRSGIWLHVVGYPPAPPPEPEPPAFRTLRQPRYRGSANNTASPEQEARLRLLSQRVINGALGKPAPSGGWRKPDEFQANGSGRLLGASGRDPAEPGR